MHGNIVFTICIAFYLQHLTCQLVPTETETLRTQYVFAKTNRWWTIPIFTLVFHLGVKKNLGVSGEGFREGGEVFSLSGGLLYTGIKYTNSRFFVLFL